MVALGRPICVNLDLYRNTTRKWIRSEIFATTNKQQPIMAHCELLQVFSYVQGAIYDLL